MSALRQDRVRYEGATVKNTMKKREEVFLMHPIGGNPKSGIRSRSNRFDEPVLI